MTASCNPTVSIIGAGPAGLMAADRLSAAGFAVTVYDKMPSPARKFLMAGRGGLNLTHSEDTETFLSRYGLAAARLRPCLELFSPSDLRNFADEMGAETFVGSSGRVFPKAMKASPLLRAWLSRLNDQGVVFKPRHNLINFDENGLCFESPDCKVTASSDITILALGGASWPRLGADGSWMRHIVAKGVEANAFRPANMGFEARLGHDFYERFAGQPLKNIAISFAGLSARGDAMISKNGIEGGAIYALSAPIRDAIYELGAQTITIDFRPDLSHAAIAARLAKPRGKMSQSNYLRKMLNLNSHTLGLLRASQKGDISPNLIKVCPVTLTQAQGIERAISSAGGISFDAVTDDFELKALPSVYAIGEMLDWEAPTGGYLLQACFSTAHYMAHRLMHKYHKSTS